MSIQITTSFVEQYSSNVTMLSQQMGSKLKRLCGCGKYQWQKCVF